MAAHRHFGADAVVFAESPRAAADWNGRHDKTMLIAGAGSLRYGEIVQVIDAATGAGAQRVGIVTDGMGRDAR
jgi:biopolymer transport protein ExbD